MLARLAEEGPEGGTGGETGSEGDDEDARAHARREGSGGKESDETSGASSPPAAAAAHASGAPAGFVAFLFLVAATAGGVFHYRRANDGRFPTPPPGTGDAVRAVVAKGREGRRGAATSSAPNGTNSRRRLAARARRDTPGSDSTTIVRETASGSRR